MSEMTQSSDSEILRRAEEVHTYIAKRFGRALHLTVTENRVRYVSFAERDGVLRLRLHRKFLDANRKVLDALAKWLREPKRKAPARVQEFVKSVAPRSPAPAHARSLVLRPIGLVHDLRRIHRETNNRFFGGQITAPITWGNNSRRTKVRRRQLGSYQRRSRVIRIHPVLDQEEVPEFVVAVVVYHEMLHSLQPEDEKRPHSAAFQRRLKEHPDFERAQAWRQAHLSLLGFDCVKAAPGE